MSTHILSISPEEHESELRTVTSREKKTTPTTWKLFAIVVVTVIVVVSVTRPFTRDSPLASKNVRMASRNPDGAFHNKIIFIHGDGEISFHFGYTGSNGPEFWARNIPTCGGRRQSPIDIVTSNTETEGEKVKFLYESPIRIGAMEHNSHTVDVMFPNKANSATFRNQKYDFAQFHFHHPSEHKIDGKHADVEVHWVHVSKNGKFLVVSMMCYKSADTETEKPNQLLEDIIVKSNSFPIAALQKGPLELDDVNVLSEIGIMSGETTPAYQYEGSLTTPPCTETASWFVMKEKFYISEQAFHILTRSFPFNSRPVQDRNYRVVMSGSLESS